MRFVALDRFAPRPLSACRVLGFSIRSFNVTGEAQVGRTATRIRFRRSCKSLAQNLPSPARNRASPGRLSWIDTLRIAAAPLRAADSVAANPLRSQDAPSFHKYACSCARSVTALPHLQNEHGTEPRLCIFDINQKVRSMSAWAASRHPEVGTSPQNSAAGMSKNSYGPEPLSGFGP